MKEALVSKGPSVRIIDRAIPTPAASQVLIRVVVSGSNPKDWKMPQFRPGETNQGDDIAGVIAAVGDDVTEFKPGDRVAAFHEMMSPNGSWAEYAIAWAHSTFHIPAKTSFEEAATIPLAAMTAAIGMYVDQALPLPWAPATEEVPLIIYGAAGAVGSYALQLAVRSNVHPIICVAGSSAPFVETLIDRTKGDTIVDYREGDEAVVAGLKEAIGDRTVQHVFDAVSEHNSVPNLCKVLPKGAKINLVLGGQFNKRDDNLPEGITTVTTGVGRVHRDLKDFAFAFFRLLGKGLQDGWFKGQPHEVVPGGLAGVETGLRNLMEGKAHGFTYCFRIEETEGAGQDKL